MRLRRNLFWVFAIAAAAAAMWYRASVFSKPAPREYGRLVLVTGGSAPYWQSIAAGARAAASDRQIDLAVEMPATNESVEEQTDLLVKLDLTGVDGIALSPLDAEGQTSLINKMIQSVFVVTVDSDAQLSLRDTYIGANNFVAGTQAAQLVHEAIPDGGKVAVVLANIAKDNLIQRKAGFEESINKSTGDDEPQTARYDVVGYLVDEGSESRSRELVNDAIKNHPDLKCIVGMNAQHGPILLDVLREAGKLGDVKLVTFDYEDDTLTGIENGHIYATVVQDPFQYGYEAVRRLDVLRRGDEFERPLAGFRSSLSIVTQAITKQNLAEFRQRIESQQKETPAERTKSRDTERRSGDAR